MKCTEAIMDPLSMPEGRYPIHPTTGAADSTSNLSRQNIQLLSQATEN